MGREEVIKRLPGTQRGVAGSLDVQLTLKVSDQVSDYPL